MPKGEKMKTKLIQTLKLLQRIILGILPSFVRSQLSSNTSKIQRIHSTSYFDGLRGVASFIVFLGHYTEENVGWYSEPYGLYEDGASSSLLQLSIIRVIYSGRPMVHIFYIISGFVLSYKPLKQINSQHFSALANTLSSSIFRRGIRLFLPSFATLLIMAFSVGLGLSDHRYVSVSGGIISQLYNALYRCWELLGASWAINSFNNFFPEYNPALWSIPVEFSQSLILYGIILGLSRCKFKLRFMMACLILLYCFKSGHIYTSEFLGGSLIADLILIQDCSSISSHSSLSTLPVFKFQTKDISISRCELKVKQILLQVFWTINLLCGLYIASWTNKHSEDVWFFSFLIRNTPEPYDISNAQNVWLCFAAFQIVSSSTQLCWLKNIFLMSIPQYLGDISFSLYLTHNLCLTILEPRFAPILDHLIGKTTCWQRQIFWAAGLTFYLPIIIIVSDIFWRLIDNPSISFAHWIESKCVVEKKL